jgi:hypothetical protein
MFAECVVKTVDELKVGVADLLALGGINTALLSIFVFLH